MTTQANTTDLPPTLDTFDPSKLNIAVALSLTLPGTSTLAMGLLLRGLIEGEIKRSTEGPMVAHLLIFRSDIPKPAFAITHLFEGVVWFANFDQISYTHSPQDPGMTSGARVLAAIKRAIQSIELLGCSIAYWDIREQIWRQIFGMPCRFEGVFSDAGFDAARASFLKEQELHRDRIKQIGHLLSSIARNNERHSHS